MKINPTQRTQLHGTEREAQARSRVQTHADDASAATTVHRSSFMSALQDVKPAPVRSDLVQEVKAAIADGTFEASINLDDVIDSLLADL